MVFLYARGHTDSKWVNGWEISGQERFYSGGWVFTYFQCLLFLCADGWSRLFCTIWYSAIWHFFSINTYLLEIFLNSRIKRNYFRYINNNPFFDVCHWILIHCSIRFASIFVILRTWIFTVEFLDSFFLNGGECFGV